MNERAKRLHEAYEYLRNKGIVHTQADVANKMGATQPNVSSALKGDEKVLTDRFCKRFNLAFGNIFDENWLLTGDRDMLRPQIIQQTGDIEGPANNVNVYNSPSVLEKAIDNIKEQMELTSRAHELLANAQRQTDKAQEQIDRLLGIIEGFRN